MEPELVAKPLKKFGLEIEEGGICRKQAVRSKLCILKHTHTHTTKKQVRDKMCSHAVGNSSVERNQEDTCEKWENHCVDSQRTGRVAWGLTFARKRDCLFPVTGRKETMGTDGVILVDL